MKLEIVGVSIDDELGFLAGVTWLDDNVAEVKLSKERASHTAESWRELADKVSEAIDMMFPKP